MGRKILFTIGVVAQILISASAWAVPNAINFQGKLTDGSGKALSGTFGMQFFLCDAPEEGNCNLVDEQDVEITDGIFDVLLGNGTPIPTSIFESDPLYLEVHIGRDSEWEVLGPRQPIASVPYARMAEDSDRLDGLHAGDFAEAVHVHSGSDITSGTIYEARIASSIARDTEILPIVFDGDGSGSGLDADFLDGNDSSAFASQVHSHDEIYVNEGQANSVNSAMIVNGSISSADLQNGAALAEIQDNDGAGSGLDADMVDGKQAYEFAAVTHDHVGAEWYANIQWSQGAFKVLNSGNGPTIWGWNGGGGNGIRGYALGSGLGVYGESVDNAGVTGRSTTGNGVEGYGGSGKFDFYAGGAGSNYGPFTGSHEVILAEGFPLEVIPGMIVAMTGKAETRLKKDGSTSLSSTLPTVMLSYVENDKTVLGALVSESSLPKDHWYKVREGERFAVVNALGEGRVWVTNINGDIKVGDYITSSTLPGYGKRQDDDLLHSYTIGKAIETVDWNSVTETIRHDGKAVKVYLIAVIYTSG